VPIDSGEAGGLLADLDEHERNASWHFVDRDGDRWSGGTAVVPMLRELPAGARLAAPLVRYPGLTERAYAWVARHRGAIGRLIPAQARRRADARIERRQTGRG
jgi:predicted DCC family thiol-disulfide oxidoreductase YuxK